MTTHTLTGFATIFDINDNPVSVRPVTLQVTYADGQDFINYSIIGGAPGEIPEVDIGGPTPLGVVLDGAPIPNNAEAYIGFIRTAAGDHIILDFFDPLTGEDFIFQIGGPPLALPGTVAELNTILAAITAEGTATGAFAPGVNIPLSSFLNVATTENDTINGGLGADSLPGGIGDDILNGGAGGHARRRGRGGHARRRVRV